MKLVRLAQLDTTTWRDPRILIIYTTQSYSALPIAALRAQFPNLQIFGSSSTHGVFTCDGFKRGSYGILFEGIDQEIVRPTLIDYGDVTDIRSHVADALRALPPISDRPKTIALNVTPGNEESVLQGIMDAWGCNTMLFGGSAGYDRFLREPYVFLNERKTTAGALICESYSAHTQATTSASGYLLTEKTGIITKADGRLILEIDGRPATEVFDEWTEGVFSAELKRDGDLPRSSARFPLGRIKETSTEFNTWLTHIKGVKGTALRAYAELAVGTRVCLMRASADRVIDYVSTTLPQVFSKVNVADVRAGFVVFCAGSADLVAERIGEINKIFVDTFGNIPFIGMSSYGEQGRFGIDESIMHGNMMINVFLIM